MSPRLRLTLILFLGAHVALAQVPAIQKVEPLNAQPNDTILITGSGFSDNTAELEVWFGQVAGNVIASSEFAIEVVVPAEARLSSVEVLNKASFAATKSSLKFMPVFQGQTPFSASKFNTALVEGANLFSAPEELWDLSATDLDVDGKPDIVVTKFQSAAPFTLGTDIMVLLNVSTPGNLDFNKFDKTNLPVLNLTFPSDNVVTGDLQGDGKPDIVVSRGGSTRNSIQILRNTSVPGALNFVKLAPLNLDVGHVATRMRIRDLNRDGKPEIIVSNAFNHIFYIFINQSAGGTLTFNPTPIKLSMRAFASDPSTTNYEIEVEDFNGDDLPDLVVNEFQDDSLHIFRNTSAGAISFAARVTIPTTEKLNRLASVDVNADGKLDLLATSTLNDQLLVFTNESSGTTISFSAVPEALNTATGIWGVDVADIDGNGAPDLINVNRNDFDISDSQINIFTHNGNFSDPGFTRSNISMPHPGRNVKVADYDGDGKPDIAFTAFNPSVTPNTSSLAILRNTNCHQPEITNPEPVLICASQTIVLKTTPAEGVTYEWKRNNVVVGGDEPFLTITAPGANYTVTATAEGGACVVTSPTLTVADDTGNAPANPAIKANTLTTSDIAMCTGGDLQLETDPVPGGTFSWTGPDGFTSNLEDPIVTNMTQDQAGFYELQVTVDVCKSNVSSVRVDVADLADFAITSNNATNVVCAGGSVALSVNNLANHDYQWKFNGADITTNGATANLTATAEGDYSVEVTNNDLACTTEIGPVAITVVTAPVADYDVAATACTGEEVAFTNQSTVDSRATTVYTWAFGDGDTEQTENTTHVYSTAQLFNTTLTVSYSGVTGCTDNAANPITVAAASQPAITSTAVDLCPDGAATLTVSAAFAEILWSTTETASSITVVGPGTYTVNTTDNNGCPGTDEVVIAALPVPELAATATPEIVPMFATSQLEATSADGAAIESYSWEPAEFLDDSFIANPVATLEATTEFTVTGTNGDNCSAQASVIVSVEGVLGFPVFFSPNGDGKNDEWNIRAQDKPECTLSIFDGRGRRVYEAQGQNWDGTYEGKAVPTGTYYYVFGCPDEKPATGTVLVVK